MVHQALLCISPHTISPELAVLVFIHGESWSWGSASLYDARVLATLGKIIVVTFNYRIGVLGLTRTLILNVIFLKLQKYQ